MRNTALLLVGVTLLISCGNSDHKSVKAVIATNNLEAIRAKHAALENEKITLSKQIQLLQEKIETLDPQKKRPLVTTLTVTHEAFDHFITLQGSVETKQNLIIYPEYAGILAKVLVKEGQHVTKGQILAEINDGGLRQQLTQLQIRMALAQTTFERQRRLWQQKIGSEIQYLQAKSTYEAERQAVAQLQQQLAKATVRAPFTGTIDEVITNQGHVVAPGQSQLFRIVNLDKMYVEAEVPESYIASVTPGKRVEVSFPVLGEKVVAKIRQAGHYIDPGNRTFKVEIPLPNKKNLVKPNLTAKLKINDYTNNKAILIPQDVISENASGAQYVYLAINKTDNRATAKRVIVKTGKTQGNVIEVLSGLNDGDDIINEGARRVEEGLEVQLLNRS